MARYDYLRGAVVLLNRGIDQRSFPNAEERGRELLSSPFEEAFYVGPSQRNAAVF